MPGFYDTPFEVPGGVSNIDLSTSSATTSSALLSSVRAERQAREARRRQELSVLVLQRMWRGRVEGGKVRKGLLERLENGDIQGWEKRGRALVVVLRGGWGGSGSGGSENEMERRCKVLREWCEMGKEGQDGTSIPLFTSLVGVSEGWSTILAVLTVHILNLVVLDPRTSNAAKLLDALEIIFDPKSWSHLDADTAVREKAELVESIARVEWVEGLVSALNKLVAASLPKKKHPLLVPITRLLTAPFSLLPATMDSPLLPPLIHTLLAVPALPSVLPIPALTQLSSALPIFTLLLPLASGSPDILNSGQLVTEQGKTYFLANLATFGITGGMLSRYGTNGGMAWIKVLCTVTSGLGEGWGKWVEGEIQTGHVDLVTRENSDSEDDDSTPRRAIPPKSKTHVHHPDPLPINIRSKLVLLASSSHLVTLADLLISSTSKAPTTVLVDFASFALSLLNAFRGSPKWESILETLMEGKRAKLLGRRIWREGVRGRWRNSGERAGWDTFAENPSTSCLLLLTHMYCHYLLITPDDEFFDASSTTNLLPVDELLELAGIWRDLAFWSYMNGVASTESNSEKGVGSEDTRSLLTRAATRVAERNARRKFVAEDFWVMVPKSDLSGFVQAAVFDDAELSMPDGGDDEGNTPRWAREKQKFTKRQLAYISPRLGLLNNLPMTVPFMTRLEVFRQFIEMDYDQWRNRRSSAQRHLLRATIHRDSLAEDGFTQLNDAGPALRNRIYITFIDKFGTEESGIDGGGLFKEFLTSLSKEVFDTNRGLWLATDQNQLYPNPHSYATESHQLSWYAFIGRILGKALYEGILVDVSFADFFLAKWLGRQSYLDDLESLDADLYKGLIMLKNYPKAEDLSLYFTITQEEFGVTQSVDLVPGGSEIQVTAENRHEYIQLVCKHKLDRQISAQSRAFFHGLSEIVDPKWLRMFDQRELRQLVGGEESPIDINDLRAHTSVSGFPNDTTMQLFWKVVKGFSQEERRALIRFVTSCSRPPLQGFSHLNPNFGIRWSGSDTTRLPSASSCFNMLKLPGYMDEESLRSKLLQAITSGAGFDMS